MDLGCVWHIVGAWVDSNDITHTHAKVASHNLVHEDALVIGIGLLSDKGNANSLLSLLAYDYTNAKNG